MHSFSRKPRPSAAPSPASKPAPQRPAKTPPPNPVWLRLATSTGATAAAASAAQATAGGAAGPPSAPGGAAPGGGTGKAGPASSAVPASVHAALAGAGRPLDGAARARFEPGLGSLAGVRVHTGPQASASARDLGALAYAAGRDIVFADGQLAPHTPAGARLLAHELAHVAQQPGGRAEGPLALGAPGDGYERNADAVADAVLLGRPAPPVLRAPARVQRQPAPPAPTTQQPAASPAAQLYAQALPLVQSLDASVFALLSKAPLGGGPQEVARSKVDPEKPGDPPKTIVFKLEVVLASLPSTVDAQFDARAGSVPQTSLPAGGVQFTFTPAILVNSALAPGTTARAMAEVLVHEGTHLQIMMDPLLNKRSQHFSKFERYKQIAEKQGAGFRRRIGFFIELVYVKRNMAITPEQLDKDAGKVFSLLVEEKYVYDQDVTRLGTYRGNQRIASDYIVMGLDAVGIPPAAQPRPQITNLIQDGETFLSILDQWLYTIPLPKHPPDIMPMPLPVLP